MRAVHWNAYVVSTRLYPAQACSPPPPEEARLNELCRRITGAPWAPPYVFQAIGVVRGVSGAPKCPVLAAKMAGV
eukprot:13074657-Alexandrium_andersonii.AAC.1